MFITPSITFIVVLPILIPNNHLLRLLDKSLTIDDYSKVEASEALARKFDYVKSRELMDHIDKVNFS